jgi:hypothetical protein
MVHYLQYDTCYHEPLRRCSMSHYARNYMIRFSCRHSPLILSDASSHINIFILSLLLTYV